MQYECFINNYDADTMTHGVFETQEELEAFIHNKGYLDVYSVPHGTSPRTHLNGVTEYRAFFQKAWNITAELCEQMGTTE